MKIFSRFILPAVNKISLMHAITQFTMMAMDSLMMASTFTQLMKSVSLNTLE